MTKKKEEEAATAHVGIKQHDICLFKVYIPFEISLHFPPPNFMSEHSWNASTMRVDTLLHNRHAWSKHEWLLHFVVPSLLRSFSSLAPALSFLCYVVVVNLVFYLFFRCYLFVMLVKRYDTPQDMER